jgi:hypothetical protein
MSRNASVTSVSATTYAGSVPATIAQNKQGTAGERSGIHHYPSRRGFTGVQ